MLEILAEIEAVKGQSKRSKEQIKLWLRSWMSLFGEYTKDQVLSAVRRAFLQTEYEPAPSIVNKILKEQISANIGHLLSGEEVWARLTEKARGNWTEARLFKCLSDNGLPHVARAVKAIGWETIQYTDFEDLKWVRKNFIDLYNRICEQGDDVSSSLTGIPSSVAKLLSDIPVKRIQ